MDFCMWVLLILIRIFSDCDNNGIDGNSAGNRREKNRECVE